MPDQPLIVYWISNRMSHGAPSLRHSLPFADLRAARAWAKAHVDEGKANLAVVVSWRDDPAGRVLAIYPAAAKRLVEHYEDILDRAADGPPR